MADPLTIYDIVGYDSTMAVKVSAIQSAVANGQIPAHQATEFFESISGETMKPIRAYNGDILTWAVDDTATVTKTSPINSNASTLSRGTISAPVSTTVEAGTNVAKVSRLSGVGSKIMTVGSKLALPVALASIGITLGKTIDETLYNLNPNFWNSIGANTLNPQTWSSIAGGDGTLGGSFINALFGIDPQTGESQAYIDADTLAYLSYVLNDAGVFNNSGSYYEPISSDYSYMPTLKILSGTLEQQTISTSATGSRTGAFLFIPFTDGAIQAIRFNDSFSGNNVKYAATYNDSSNRYPVVNIASSVNIGNFTNYIKYSNSAYFTSLGGGSLSTRTVDDKAMYWCSPVVPNEIADNYSIPLSGAQTDFISYGQNGWQNIYTMLYGTLKEISGGIDGIGNQPNAIIPDFSNLTQDQYLPYLENLYPDMFNDAITYPVMQPDGTVNEHKYLPITLPQTSNMTNTQPVSGEQTQVNPAIDPLTAPQTIVELLTKLLQQPVNEPISDTEIPPEQPTDTGDGSSPQIIMPTGRASSLWKIYHPTQAQIDSFGSWLWSSDFIDQILKIFNNPMEAIIGLHQIYVTPIDDGSTTIKVGYLDSHVPSAYINQQYIYVDCGSVNLSEQFGNVFDYSPFTDVKLYLPFVGIVSLDVSDIMRSSINIQYGVDVITGACLAMVKVARDSNNSVLYQYSGNCAVQYPISSGSYMGIVSSIISIAGGIAATAATGGSVAPLAIGSLGAAMNAHTSVQHSGSFSGNSGAMGGKIPYLIISRPQTKLSQNFPNMEGYPTNYYTTVGACSGYIKAKSAHVTVDATDEELTEINNYLLSGIII